MRGMDTLLRATMLVAGHPSMPRWFHDWGWPLVPRCRTLAGLASFLALLGPSDVLAAAAAPPGLLVRAGVPVCHGSCVRKGRLVAPFAARSAPAATASTGHSLHTGRPPTLQISTFSSHAFWPLTAQGRLSSTGSAFVQSLKLNSSVLQEDDLGERKNGISGGITQN